MTEDRADGWVMVPREPTEAMLRAPRIGVSETVRAEIWSAMLAAAPATPPSTDAPCPECGDTSPLPECATCGCYPLRQPAPDTAGDVKRIRRAYDPLEASDDLRAENERLRIIGEARRNLALTRGCMECNAEDERRWQETIEWLETLA